jgi:16S rRNA C1402 N4-methylase RsmH
VIISFHSLKDRLVKMPFGDGAALVCVLRALVFRAAGAEGESSDKGR